MSPALKKKEFIKNFDKYLKNKKNKKDFDDEFSYYIRKSQIPLPEFLEVEQNNKQILVNELLKSFGDTGVYDELNEIYQADLNLRQLGAEIKRLRLAQGWSTHKLSDLSQMSIGFINQLENGKSSLPKASNLTRLAKIFNVNPDNFLYLAGYISQQPVVEFDWKISIKNQLSDIGINNSNINSIIDYIETVQIKQSLQKNEVLND